MDRFTDFWLVSYIVFFKGYFFYFLLYVSLQRSSGKVWKLVTCTTVSRLNKGNYTKCLANEWQSEVKTIFEGGGNNLQAIFPSFNFNCIDWFMVQCQKICHIMYYATLFEVRLNTVIVYCRLNDSVIVIKFNASN